MTTKISNLSVNLFFVSIISLLATYVDSACRTPFSGVQNNLPFSYMSSYSQVYNRPYSYASSTSEINSIRNSCSASSILCVGCYAAYSSYLTSVACGGCLQITQQTTMNTPNLVNGVYWYFTSSYSFGYSDTYSINQNSADIDSQSDASKISWHVDQGVGGWRCGSNTYLNGDNTYYKVIYQF